MPEAQPPEPREEGSREHGPFRKAMDPVITFHHEHPIYFWLLVTGLVAAVFTVGSVVAPGIFRDWLWTHIWGPTVADANQTGVATRFGITVSEDYTLTSEIVYGLILAGALTSLYVHLFDKRGIEVDGRFIASLLPYIFFGPLARSLEDASLFCEAGTQTIRNCDPGIFSYVFISPFIYGLTAAAVIAHILIAHRLRSADPATRTKVIGAWLLAQTAGYTAIYYGARDQFVVLEHPLMYLLLAAAALGVYVLATRNGGSPFHWALASLGLPMVLIPVAQIARWELEAPWLEPIRDPARRAIPVVLGLTLAVIGIITIVALLLRRDAPEFAYFLTPLNIGLIGGHMIDGFATFTAICSDAASTICNGAAFLGVQTSGYGEKHPVSEFFLQFADGWGFPFMKLLLVTVIIVLIDRSARDGDEDPNLVGLVKLAVLVLGLAPGTRDLVRVAMGV